MKTIKYFFSLILFMGFSLVLFSQEEIDVLILNKKYEQAVQEIDKRLEINPTADLYFKKGVVLGNLQNYQESINALSKALALNPDNIEILTEMAENLSTVGNQEDAEEYFFKTVQLNPQNLTLKAKLGKVYINQKKIKEAYKLFNEIYAVDSLNVYWNKQYAYCCYQLGDRKKAVQIYEKVLELNPRDHGTYINLIHAYHWKNDDDSIRSIIQKGLEQFPGNYELYFELANFNFKNNNYDEAKKAYENYFESGGDSTYDDVLNYAISTYFSYDDKDALSIFGRLFRANPNDPFVEYYLALCYKKRNNLEDAAKYMQWAIESSYPDYLPKFYHHLGQILGLDRKFKESISALKKANELDPTQHEVLFEIATTYEEFNNNKTLALNYYQLYLKEAGESGKNIDYALSRITKIKEDMFFEQ